jgi:hypothetical protein
MPRNPNKRRCIHPGCDAWARRDIEQPYCAAHARLVLDLPPSGTIPPGFAADTAGEPPPGAPPGNQNRLFHGFYRRTLADEEADDLAECGELDDSLHNNLIAEILIARVALRRTLAMLGTGTTLGDSSRELGREEYVRLISLSFQGVRTIARLLAVQRKLGTGENIWSEILNTTLDELSEEWGIDL